MPIRVLTISLEEEGREEDHPSLPKRGTFPHFKNSKA
jgi:hypothetical protein